jgi:transcriptional regulator with XRE-family HTH domain
MDPYTDPLVFGQRLQILRTRKGLTRDQLGGLVGRSGSWVKGVETGRPKTPKLETILGVGPGHPRLAAVKAAVDAFPVVTAREASSTAHTRLGWRARGRHGTRLPTTVR